MPNTIEEFTDNQLQDELKKRKDKSHLVEELEDLNSKIRELEKRKHEILEQLGK